jgi:acyl carrier protein
MIGDVARGVRVIIARQLACPMRRLASDDAEFRNDLGADSLDLVQIPCALEEAFGVRFTDDEVAFCQTIGTAVDLVRTKLENRSALA